MNNCKLYGVLCGGKWDRAHDIRRRVYAVDGVSLTLTTCEVKIMKNMRIRKLTPKECFRLMGFDDEGFEKAEEVNSNSQLYKQAGNSIVVDVLMAIFKEMIE